MFDRHDFTFTDDDRVNRRNWRVQRIAWCITALALIAIACGVIGDGFLTKRVVSSKDDAFQLGFYSIVHNEAETELTVRTTTDVSHLAGIISLQLGEDFSGRAKLVRTVPEYAAASSIADETIYRWNPDDPPRAIVLTVQYEHAGQMQGRLTLNNSQVIDFRQFCLP